MENDWLAVVFEVDRCFKIGFSRNKTSVFFHTPPATTMVSDERLYEAAHAEI